MRFFTALMIVAIGALKSSVAQQPVLFGTTTTGNGGIYRFDTKDNSHKNLYRFNNSGIFDYTKMIVATNGKIYGVAYGFWGGGLGYGIIFSLDPVTSKYKIERNFQHSDGGAPSSLVQGKDGKLYGTAGWTLFSFDPISSVFKIQVNFNEKNAHSAGPITLASDGLLYGKAQAYTSDQFFLFSYNPVSKEFRREILLPEDFTDNDVDVSEQLHQPMIEGKDGILYGVTAFGGANRAGYLYSYSLSSKQFTKLIGFNYQLGEHPNGALTLASDGLFYSTTLSGGANSHGTIFCYDPIQNFIKVIHHFDGIQGSRSRAGLCEGENGKLYGIIAKSFIEPNSGYTGCLFYSMDKSGINYKVLRNFDAIGPSQDLGQGNFIVANHKIYGIAYDKMATSNPYIFSYEASSDIFQKIIRTNLDKGLWPDGNMLQATDGRFYGTVTKGGGFGFGGIFSFNPGTQSYTMLMPFNVERGITPINGIVQASNGKIYGLNFTGGSASTGVIYSFDPRNSRYHVEKNFSWDLQPFTGFALGSDGKLYSTIAKLVKISEGGYEQQYFIFSFDPQTGNYKELHRFEHAGIFTTSSNGKLYVGTSVGIYRYDPDTNILKLNPYPDPSSHPDFVRSGFSERLVEAADHKIYGIWTSDDANESGILYSFDPSDGSFSDVYTFDINSGAFPNGSLLYASDGLLYGTMQVRGKYDYGTLFRIDPVAKSIQVLHNFNQLAGIPGPGPLVELDMSTPPIVSITDKKMFEGETVDLTVSLNRVSMEETILNYRTVPGTASDNAANPDFTPVSGQLVIPPGEISTRISVSLLEDELIEKRETFTVVLQKANDAVFHLGDSIGVINIKNGSARIIPPGGEIITIPPMLSTVTESIVMDKLVIQAAPNPSSSFFSLHISGTSTDRVSVTVTNLSGQILDKFDRALNNSALTFGLNYTSGSYFVRIVNGGKSKVIKLIKTSK